MTDPPEEDEHKLTTNCINQLLACHVQASDGLDLLCLLRQSAAVTAADVAQVTHEATFNSLLLTHLHINTNSIAVSLTCNGIALQKDAGSKLGR